MRFKFFFSFFFLALTYFQSNLVIQAFEQSTERHNATLISEQSHFSKETFKLGVLIDAPQEAHIYGRYPGEIGSPLNIKWHLPEGFVLKSVFWPVPEVFKDSLIFSGYRNSVLIIAEILPPETISEGQVFHFEAQVDWLACDLECFPGSRKVSCDLVYSETVPSYVRDGVSEIFAKTMNNFTSTMAEDKIAASSDGQQLILRLKDIRKSYAKEIVNAFFITSFEGLDYSKPPLVIQENSDLLLKVDLLEGTESPLRNFEGLLFLKDASGKEIDVLSVSALEIMTAHGAGGTFWAACTIFLCAFIGGILLNVMPCVLPMVTVKIYELIKSSGDSRVRMVKNSLLFSGGVIGCFWLLAAVSCGLKALGHNVGWGFQLQEPLFVGALAIIFFAFGLSSLGVFELGTSFLSLGSKRRASSEGWSSLFNGVLATLITTPCTGPLLGSVIGFATSLSVFRQLGIFTLIGCGMASPYLLLALSPKLTALLPKPGAWMSIFKQLMGFMMLGTVIWLLWVFGSETSTSSLILLLVGLFIIGMAVWMLGKWGNPTIPQLKRRLVCCTAVLLICSAGFLTVKASRFSQLDDEMTSNHSEGMIGQFSLENLTKARREHKGVFVDFTAKWCLTCQLNKSVLHTKQFFDFCNRNDIVFMSADWTKKNPEITEELTRLGRAGVPLYVFYAADDSIPPKILSQSVSSESLERELTMALAMR